MTTLYEQYHQNCGFAEFGRSTFHADKALIAYPDAGDALDLGCGNGYAVRQMRERGLPWFGIEHSRTAFERDLREPWFFHGETTQFAAGQFDLAYSTEVLEHIPEDQAPAVVADLCRVTRRYMFLTISLRPSSDNNRYHCTLKPRAWWEALFTQNGFVVDTEVVRAFQPVTMQSTRQILRRWAHLGPIPQEFAKNPPYELFGETQFWFFAFRREGVPPPVTLQSQVPWRQRTLYPWLRRWLRLDPPRNRPR